MRCIMNLKSGIAKLAGHRILALNRGENEKYPHREGAGTGRIVSFPIWSGK